MRNVIVAGALLALVGCGPTERVLATSPDTVIVETQRIGGNRQAALDLAARECQRHGRRGAVLTTSQRVVDFEEMAFQCRP